MSFAFFIFSFCWKHIGIRNVYSTKVRMVFDSAGPVLKIMCPVVYQSSKNGFVGLRLFEKKILGLSVIWKNKFGPVSVLDLPKKLTDLLKSGNFLANLLTSMSASVIHFWSGQLFTDPSLINWLKFFYFFMNIGRNKLVLLLWLGLLLLLIIVGISIPIVLNSRNRFTPQSSKLVFAGY